MRRTITLATIMLLAGPAAAKPGPEFTAIAAAGAPERIDLTGVSFWQSGDFRLGTDGTTGHVRRRSRGESYGAPALDPAATRAERDGFAAIVRSGSLRFTLGGPSAGAGALTGECGFDRTEERVTAGALTLADPVAPLALDCRFARDGRMVGELRLEGVFQTRGIVSRTARVGSVTVDGTTLTIRSLHRTGYLGIKSDTPLGYAFSVGGSDIGAVDLTAARKRRLALPRDPAQRAAALAAAVTLGLFWDPGDTDD